MCKLLTCLQFIREDLEHNGDDTDMPASFHGTDDLISVHELWQIWINSTGKSDSSNFINLSSCWLPVFSCFANYAAAIATPCLSAYVDNNCIL